MSFKIRLDVILFYESQHLQEGFLYKNKCLDGHEWFIYSFTFDRREETEEERVNVHGDAACFFFPEQNRKRQCSRGSLGTWINTGAMMRQ